MDSTLSDEDIIKKVGTLEANMRKLLSVSKLKKISKLETKLESIEK